MGWVIAMRGTAMPAPSARPPAIRARRDGTVTIGSPVLRSCRRASIDRARRLVETVEHVVELIQCRIVDGQTAALLAVEIDRHLQAKLGSELALEADRVGIARLRGRARLAAAAVQGRVFRRLRELRRAPAPLAGDDLEMLQPIGIRSNH